jgi:two-component system response regulator HydG
VFPINAEVASPRDVFFVHRLDGHPKMASQSPASAYPYSHPLRAPDPTQPARASVTPRLFVVDDELPVLDIVRRFAAALGFEVHTFSDGNEALLAAGRATPDLALVDLRMPAINGLSVLREIKRRAPLCDVVLMTGFGSIDSAVEAVKLGAADYLSKPLDFDRLKELLRMTRQEVERRAEIAALEEDLVRHVRFEGMVGRSAGMLELFSLIRRIAPHFTTALITGETGSGKELVARALHALSKRRDRAFVTVNCSAIVESLFESELFGHVRGAFTGATDTKPGLFERANGGTIFLDEIGELPLAMQAKLLRVLEQGEITKVGSSEAARLDVRVIAATNRALDHEVANGRFRADLFYRLNVVMLHMPPLRERREDVPLLVRAFLEEFARQFGKTFRGVSMRAEQLLGQYDWPGNVRELKNAVERACMLAEGDFLDDFDLVLRPIAAAAAAPTAGPIRPIADLERDEIVRALEETRGNKNQAARRLGISRRALYRRLEKFGLGATHQA